MLMDSGPTFITQLVRLLSASPRACRIQPFNQNAVVFLFAFIDFIQQRFGIVTF